MAYNLKSVALEINVLAWVLQRMCCSFELYKKNGVSCVVSDLLFEWALSTANSQRVVIRLYWDTILDQIRLWADTDRN